MNGLPPDLRDRILSITAEAPSPTRQELASKRRLVLLLALIATLGVGFMRGLPSPNGMRTAAYLGIAAGAAFVVAGLTSLWLLGPSRSPLGRPSWTRRVIAWLVPAALALGMLTANVIVPATLHAPRAPLMADLMCLAIYVLLGTMLLGAMVWLERDSDPVSPGITGASLAALAGAWTAFAMALQCPIVEPAHVLATHVLPAVLLVVVGLMLGKRYVAMRARP